MMLIGSHAMTSLGFQRIPKDWDYLCNKLEYDNFVVENLQRIVLEKPTKYGFIVHMIGSTPIEFELAEKRGSTKMLLDMKKPVDIDLLYTLKMSHRFLKNSPHFLKTRNDILTLRKAGAQIPDEFREFYNLRRKETYDYKHPVLNQSKKDFFSDDFYVYDHDTIHLAVMLYEKPAYDFIKIDTADVLCSKEKWEKTSEEIRLAMVYEESSVLALERHQIPNNFKPNYKKSFEIALQKVCTSITSGWFRTYAWESYDKVMKFFESVQPNYVQRFNTALSCGVLKPHGK